MTFLKELEGFRADVAPASPEARADGRQALAEAIRRERVGRGDVAVGGLHLAPVSDGRNPPPRSERPSRRVALGAAACLVAAAVVTGLFVAAPSGRAPAVHRSANRAASTLPLRRGVTLRLAGYDFSLPAGFKAFDGQCSPRSGKSGLRASMTPRVWKTAAAGSGACVEVQLMAGGAVVPPSAQPVEVGAYQGFLVGPVASATESSTSETLYTLYVAVPSAEGNHYLVLSAVGLAPPELMAIAEAALPGSPGGAPPCSHDCG